MPRDEPAAEGSYGRRERPWLLPHNRKLRHLHGITIRNITIPQLTTVTRERRQTIDDDAIPNSLESPSKLLAKKDKNELAHARSSSDLRAISEASVVESPKPKDAEDEKASPIRPRLSRLRRRSTMEWSGASPLARQKKLEDVAGSRMLDSFYVLAYEGEEEPIYISETSRRAMNPNFRFFDLGPCGPDITRREELTVKVFAKNGDMKNYRFVVDMRVNLSSLQFIGKSIEHFHHPLPENSILFHMTDGIYTSLTNLPSEAPSQESTTGVAKASAGRVLPTASYDALMRLTTLDTCIQDALHTRKKLTTQISKLLEENRAAFAKIGNVPEAQEATSRASGAANVQRRRLETATRKRDELKESILRRKESMRQGRDAETQAAADVNAAQQELYDKKAVVQQTLEDMVGQRRRCCEDLQSVYPIEPMPGKSLSFTIRGLPLPDSNFDDCDEVKVSAALGYAAHTVYLLSFYLSSPLPYPITPRGSTSTIHDPISQTTGPNTYPLFLKNAIRFKFEYGVFLLNKDIEILASSLGLKIIDIRQTLPNLKYLLYIATAGKGDLPARKAGGIRGLLRRGEGSGVTSPTLSRTGSFDSIDALSDGGRMHASTAAEVLRNTALERSSHTAANGKVVRGKSPAIMPTSKLRDVM